jgi:tRNA modification GTPase
MSLSSIAAIASPPGMGAVGLIRISGPDSARIADTIFRGISSKPWQARYQNFGRIVESGGEIVDEVLLTYFPGPRSFTGEDVVEIACHGGVIVTRKILRLLLSAGAEPASPGEFSERAFLNGRIDLTQAEAIMDMISAQTDLALKAAGEQLSGRLGGEVEQIRLDLVGLLAHLEAYIDFPEEDISPDSLDVLIRKLEGIERKLNRLLATADQGRILRDGLRTVICGAPNAGKSSLLNRLLGFERAIVNERAGTTRDTIEEVINLKGIPLRLIDTAGIREGADAIEQEGIHRSNAQISMADLALVVIDSSKGREEILSVSIPEQTRSLYILNKSDLPTHPDWQGHEGFAFTCLNDHSLDSLQDHLFEVISADSGLNTSDLVSINTRHQHCLARAEVELRAGKDTLQSGESPEFVAMHLRSALEAVGDVIGRTDIEEILGEIFSQFCIGK